MKRLSRWSAVGFALIIVVAFWAWLFAGPRDGQDVTDSKFNGGYIRNKVYYTTKPLGVFSTPNSVQLPVTQYRVEDLPPAQNDFSPSIYTPLPTGSRIRFDKMIWLKGHFSWEGTGGASVVAYGTILDGPREGIMVNMLFVSQRFDLVGKCMPSPDALR